jgi:hypothetical protein
MDRMVITVVPEGDDTQAFYVSWTTSIKGQIAGWARSPASATITISPESQALFVENSPLLQQDIPSEWDLTAMYNEMKASLEKGLFQVKSGQQPPSRALV